MLASDAPDHDCSLLMLVRERLLDGLPSFDAAFECLCVVWCSDVWIRSCFLRSCGRLNDLEQIWWCGEQRVQGKEGESAGGTGHPQLQSVESNRSNSGETHGTGVRLERRVDW